MTKSEKPHSRIVPGPPHLRYYSKHGVVAWQPHGVLDDQLLDEIASWLLAIEKVALPFKRFVDLSCLTTISVRIRHVFKFAHNRTKKFRGASPVKCAVFCDSFVGFEIAHLYESLMKDSLVEARAFRDRTGAADWLGVPEEILRLEDEPAVRA